MKSETTILSAEAKLRMLNVTIQALTVNGKQMTLAVFRQLPTMSLHDEYGNIFPEIRLWGLVRYSIKDDGDLWVVAEKGGILYRCNFPRQHSTRDAETNYRGEQEMFAKWEEERDEKLKSEWSRYFNITYEGYGCKPRINIFNDLYGRSGSIPINEIDNHLSERLNNAKNELMSAINIKDRIDALRSVLTGLPQLFIAV
jgi:hypothetical protein